MPRLFSTRRRTVTAGVAGLVLLAGAAAGVIAAVSGSTAAGFREDRHPVAVVDGPADDQHVSLDTDTFVPSGVSAAHPAPAVILSHGFGASLDSERGDALDAVHRGFVVLTYSARGFGQSTGEIGLDSPDYEVKDVRQLVDALATAPYVTRDGPGDPRVGLAGGSYGGGISLLAAAYDRRIDAVAAAITWNDLAQSLDPGGVFKQGWASLFFGLGTLGGDSGATASLTSGNLARLLNPQPCPGFVPEVCAAYAQTEADGIASPETVALLSRDSVSSVADRLRAPTLLMQGEQDTLFPLAQAQQTTAALAAAGVPHQEVWLAGGHDGGFGEEAGRVRGLTGTWFAKYLFGKTVDAGPTFQAARPGADVLRAADPSRTGGSVSYPLGVDRGQGAVGADKATGQLHIVNPPGGQPAAISSLPGFGSLTALAGNVTLDIPTQSASFDGPTLQSPLEVVGGGSVTLQVASTTGSAVLFAKLYDVDADKKATLPDGQLTPVRLTGLPTEGRGQRVTIALPTLSWRFATGHHLRLTIATTDQAYLGSRVGAAYTLDTTNAAFTVPLSLDPATGGLAPLAIAGIALGALLLVGAVLAVVSTRRRSRDRAVERAAAVAVAERSAPVVITGLSKRYGDADIVVDLDLRVEHGHILGLLGPNGAGKTTTLRMVLGLIRPTAGHVEIFGTTVLAGSPALRRVGAFIEGPGFVPTLSGLDNLKLWWGADGDRWEDAFADEALEVAGLGDAVHRKVKTYSQGMRQRLAIAQAMLGRPDLVVLDEPTNGLDPPQIVEMRRVILGIAERGATVLVSSHLLSEVEQVCTHVAVMSLGRLVKTGTVAEIVGGENTVAVELRNVSLAAGEAALSGAAMDLAAGRVRRLRGVTSVEVDATALVVTFDGVSRTALVAGMVRAGVPVAGFAPRRALEQAFLELVT